MSVQLAMFDRGEPVIDAMPAIATVMQASAGDDADAWLVVVDVQFADVHWRWRVAIDRLHGRWRRSAVFLSADSERFTHADRTSWRRVEREAVTAALKVAENARLERLRPTRTCACGCVFRPSARGEPAVSCPACQAVARREVFRRRAVLRRLIEVLRSHACTLEEP